MAQKTITETTSSTPKKETPSAKPTKEIKSEPKTQTKPITQEPQYKPIPPEIKILLDALEEFEGIAYAARNKIYQLYGPVDYQVQNSTKSRTIDDVRFSFPEEVEAKLSFSEEGNFIIVRSRQFLGSETFAKVASAIRGMGGEYISAGKDSHFKVRKA